MNTLRALLSSRGISQEAAGMLAGVHATTISKICSGQAKARPTTVVALAKALGVSANRMLALCDAHWLAAHPEEAMPDRTAVRA